jgi:Ser/Thr protein kinase RdoA (MazF antagonist)
VSATIRAAVERILRSRVRRHGRVVRLRRRVSPYSSTFRIDELDVSLDDGRQVAMVLKHLSPEAVLDEARDVRPEFLYEPRREIETYRRLLRPSRHDTPACYGAVVDERKGRYWLFLERVAGLELRHVSDPAAWTRAAAWLGRFHRRFQAAAARETASRGIPLLRCDAAFFRLWMDRAVRNAAAARGRRARETARRVAWLAARYDRVVGRLAALPPTIIHGEFYACNVLVREGRRATHICPVDWELTGVGPGLIDLAALTAGWDDAQKRRLLSAYQAALDETERPRVPRHVATSLEYCQLHLAVRMLGWSGDRAWTPPPQHARDWLSEAMFLAARLGL